MQLDLSYPHNTCTKKWGLDNLPTFWITLYPKERIKLNNIIFPNGLNYENGAYRTPQTHSIYGEIESISSAKNHEMSLRESISNQFYDSLQHVYSFIKEVNLQPILNNYITQGY